MNMPRRILDKNSICYEDDLPTDLSDAEYDEWYQNSWVDGVRIGYGYKYMEAGT